jgi:lambda family phage portal protein
MALFDFLKPKATDAAASGISPRRPVLSHWQAGKADNRAFRSSASSAGPNAANSGYLNTARNRARDAVRNVPYAARAVELQVTNIVGTGIVPRFADRRLQDLWLSWEDSADAAWIRDIYGLQEAATRAWLESGECFIRLRARRPGDGLPLPLQVELLESDMLPNQDWIAANGNPVYQGIELNAIGRREAYHFYLKHPGDKHLSGQSLETVRVPAERVCHLYDPARPGQLRGFPPLATVLQRMQQMSDFDEATIERQKLASALTFAIRRPQPDQPGIDPITGLDIEGRGASEISPGSAFSGVTLASSSIPPRSVASLSSPGTSRRMAATSARAACRARKAGSASAA